MITSIGQNDLYVQFGCNLFCYLLIAIFGVEQGLTPLFCLLLFKQERVDLEAPGSLPSKPWLGITNASFVRPVRYPWSEKALFKMKMTSFAQNVQERR